MQLPAAGDLEAVCVVGFLYPEADVSVQFAEKTVS